MVNLNEKLELPPIVTIDTETLPIKWQKFAEENRTRLYLVVLYHNKARNGKIWPASQIIWDGIRDGKHTRTDTIIDSTSGNYGVALAAVISHVRELWPDFPITHIKAVVSRTLEQGKRNVLMARGIELIEANDSLDAQKVAREVAEKYGYWYTEQYWNPSNSAGYWRVVKYVADQISNLGIMACGVGSGGSCTEFMRVLKERFRTRATGLYRVGVVVEESETVGGVRGEAALKPGTLPWRANIDDARFVGADPSYLFSAALWRQSVSGMYPAPVAGRNLLACMGGPSTGFVAEGAMLAARSLSIMDRLGEFRARDGFVHVAVPVLDTRDPYRAEYEKRGIYFPS